MSYQPSVFGWVFFFAAAIACGCVLGIGAWYAVDSLENREIVPASVGAVSCPTLSCPVSGESGTFCRVSVSGYRAYPEFNTTRGYRDCINRSTGDTGVWAAIPVPIEENVFNYTFSPDHCLRVGNDSLWCFATFNSTLDAMLVAEIAR